MRSMLVFSAPPRYWHRQTRRPVEFRRKGVYPKTKEPEHSLRPWFRDWIFLT